MRSRDGRYVLVHNGEIYNFRELRAELEAQGAVFSTRSDTEVLLHAYAAWGDALPRAWTACSRSRSGMRASGNCSPRATASA
jgi:asparagine synthetase B (glutamine-hydrolysing)